MHPFPSSSHLFFFNDTATTEIYTLSLHDALPIYSDRTPATASSPALPSRWRSCRSAAPRGCRPDRGSTSTWTATDRKSTRLNSSHSQISYAVFCLKKKTTLSSCPIVLVALPLPPS